MTPLNFAQGWYTSGILSSLFLLCTLAGIYIWLNELGDRRGGQNFFFFFFPLSTLVCDDTVVVVLVVTTREEATKPPCPIICYGAPFTGLTGNAGM